jgi:hypothetical protein
VRRAANLRKAADDEKTVRAALKEQERAEKDAARARRASRRG